MDWREIEGLPYEARKAEGDLCCDKSGRECAFFRGEGKMTRLCRMAPCQAKDWPDGVSRIFVRLVAEDATKGAQ